MVSTSKNTSSGIYQTRRGSPSSNDPLLQEYAEAFLYFIQARYDLIPFAKSKRGLDISLEKNGTTVNNLSGLISHYIYLTYEYKVENT